MKIAARLAPLQNLWQWTKTHTALVLGAFIAIVGLLVWHSAQDQGMFGTTGGIIVVESPEVFSRERLVNDRFKQAAWLQERLDNTEELKWGIQGEVRRQITNQQQLELAYSGSSAPGSSSAAKELPGNEAKRCLKPNRRVKFQQVSKARMA